MAKYLGVDLSTDPKKTAVCELTIDSRGVSGVSFEAVPVRPARLVVLLQDESFLRAAIDAPFGWPQAFRKEIGSWERNPTTFRSRGHLRLRETDRYVEQQLVGCHPQPVTASWLGATAMYCCELLAQVQPPQAIDRVEGHIIECYPAAAAWRFLGASKKPPRDTIFKGLEKLFPGISQAKSACAKSPHALDALIAALVAWAAERKETELPRTPKLKRAAQAEGWIHLPCPGALSNRAPRKTRLVHR